MSEELVLRNVESKAAALMAEAKSIQIVDEDSRKFAAVFSRRIGNEIKIIEDWFEDKIKIAFLAHKGLVKDKKEMIDRYKPAKELVDNEIARDYFEQEEIRIENERKLRELNEEAERKEKERLITEAEKQMDNGQLENADQLLTQADQVFYPKPILPKTEQSIHTEDGTTTVRKDIEVKVADKMAVVREVIAGKLPELIIEIDTSALKRWIKANDVKAIPGVQITPIGIVTGRK